MNRLLYILPLLLALLVSVNADAKKKKYPNGDYYEGKIKKDQPNGFGKMYYANGNFYEGNWVNGVANGQGRFIIKTAISVITQDKSKGPISKLVKTNGVTTYEGTWQNGAIIEGKMTDAQNNVYEGTFAAMEFLEGKMTYANGAWISGTWKDGKIYNGDSNGDFGSGTFNGKWLNGKFMDGYCKTVADDNFSYTGSIVGGTPFTGKGKMVLNGNSYDGKWEKGVFTGRCKQNLTSHNPLLASFEGNILADTTMNGILIYKNGNKYEGNLKRYNRDGKGTFLIAPSGHVISGTWSNDTLLTGKGETYYAGHDYFFIINHSNNNYSIQVKNAYKDQVSFQAPNSIKEEKFIPLINGTIKSKLSTLTKRRAIAYAKAEDARILSQVKTFRGEHYGIGKMTVTPVGVSETVFLYDFYDVEYQFYPQGTQDIFYGKFHAWNGRYYGDWDMLYSVEGNYKKGIKEGTWIFEEEEKRPTGVGFAKRRLTINYLHGKKNGWCTLECFTSSGSRSVIKAYYKNDVWYNKGTQYYYHFGSTERNVSFDANGKVHGNVYLRDDDIELKETYEHGRLIKSEKRNVAKGIVLSPKRGENRFQEMWKLILPTDYPGDTYDYRVDRDPLIGLTYFDLTDEGGEYNDQYIRYKKKE